MPANWPSARGVATWKRHAVGFGAVPVDGATTSEANEKDDGVPLRRRSRRWWAALGGVVVAVVMATAVPAGPRATDPLMSYDERSAPEFQLPGLAEPDNVVSLAGATGPVLVNIWASWCVPCRREMPLLQEAHEQYGDRVSFIGVNHQDQRDAALQFLRGTGVRYRSGFDPRGSTASAYGTFGLPATYFITASGRIVATKTGELTAAVLSSELDRLLQESG